jgi:hypothetical protein
LDPQSDWAHSRYEAAWQLRLLLEEIWDKSSHSVELMTAYRDAIADLLLASNAHVAQAIVNGTLEHVFEDPELAAVFAAWVSNPGLAPYFHDALDWAHGDH